MEKVSKKPTADMQAFMRDVIHESLKDWFKEKWVRINTSGNITGPCGTMKKGKTKTRCLPKAKAQSLTKAQRKATVAKKVKGGKKGKQFVKNTKAAKVKKETANPQDGKAAPYGSGYKEVKQLIRETIIEYLLEKNVPTDPAKWSYYKSQAKKKFDVYPSAYANGWAAKQYKAAGGGWKKKANEDTIQELNCKYGQYWCTTDKKHKCRKRPQSTNESMLATVAIVALSTYGFYRRMKREDQEKLLQYMEDPDALIKLILSGKEDKSWIEKTAQGLNASLVAERGKKELNLNLIKAIEARLRILQSGKNSLETKGKEIKRQSKGIRKIFK